MSKFFDDVDDSSDEETQSTHSEMSDDSDFSDNDSVSDDEYAGIDKKWLLDNSDDDDSDDEEVVVLSKNAKALKELEELNDQLDLESGGGYWTKGYASFDKLLKKSLEYAAKQGGYKPAVFIQCLSMMKDATQEKLTREECDNKSDFVHYGKLTTAVTECLETYKADIERQQRIDEGLEEAPGQGAPQDEPEEKGEDWSKEGMLKMLESLHLAKIRAQNRTLRGIVTHATQLGLHALVTTATSQLATNTLEDDLHQVTHVPAKQWKSAFDMTVKTWKLCQSHGFTITEGVDPSKITEKNTAVVPFWAQAENLYERYLQAMQFNHKINWSEKAGFNTHILPRVQEEQPFLDWIMGLMSFYEQRGTKKAILKLAIIIMDIISSRTPAQHKALCEKYKSENCSSTLEESMAKMHDIILSRGTTLEETEANLQLAYSLAARNNYYEARDLTLQTGLEKMEFSGNSMVSGNRAVAQLGLCAFRLGLFTEANTILSDLCSRPPHQIAILLGQDIAFVRDNAAKELKFRKRLLPCHRYMHVELIEAAALCSATLQAVVAEAKRPFERGNRPTYLQKLIGNQGNQIMTGAPANLKESIYACYQNINNGTVVDDLRANNDEMELFSSAVWDHLGSSKANVKSSLLQEAKIASLKVFLIKNGANYKSLAVEHLSSKFALDAPKVRSVVSSLLLDRDHVIVGYWDAKEEFLTVERGSSSKMHHLADHGADKLIQLSSGASGRFERRKRGGPYRARQ